MPEIQKKQMFVQGNMIFQLGIFPTFFEDIIRRFGLFPLPKKTTYVTVPLGDWLEKKKETALIIKQQFGSPIKIT